MKPRLFLLGTVVALLSITLSSLALGQSTQVTYTVTLNWFTLQVSYPSEAMPGNALNVTVQGTPRNGGVYLQNLNATIYYGDASGLHQLTSETLVSNSANIYTYYGQPTTGSFSKSFTVTIPQNVPRTSLIAVFSETAQYNNYYNGEYPFSFWTFGNPLFYSFYPTVTTSTDQGISPLSYVNATTPEYVALQAKYRMAQQQLNQTQAQNQQLQTTITQQSAMINQLNQEVTSANITVQAYEGVATFFIIIAIALAAVTVYQMRKKETQSRQGTDAMPETGHETNTVQETDEENRTPETKREYTGEGNAN